jgi:actin-related protein 3
LSGGSTLFRNFDRRLEKSLQKRVDDRLSKFAVAMTGNYKPKGISVNVTNSIAQKHSVWVGGSTFATMVYNILLFFI